MSLITASYHDNVSFPKEVIILQRVADDPVEEYYQLNIGWDFELFTSLERLCEIKALIERELDAAQARADEQRAKSAREDAEAKNA